MKTGMLKSLVVAGIVLMTTSGVEANDIVDILRVVNALSQERSSGRPAGYAGGPRGRSGWSDSGMSLREAQMRESYYGERDLRMSGRPTDYDVEHYSRGYNGYRDSRSAEMSGGSAGRSYSGAGRDRSRVAMREDYAGDRRGSHGAVSNGRDVRVTFQFQSGSGGASRANGPVRPAPVYAPVPPVPPVPVYRVPVVPVPAPMPMHRIGEFVRCEVPLATCVQVKDLCKAAPDAVPAVIAVRDPHACEHDSVERVVYVEILVPRCPLRKLEVSRCRTRVDLCFGEYDVEIRSRDGVVTVEYDN